MLTSNPNIHVEVVVVFYREFINISVTIKIRAHKPIRKCMKYEYYFLFIFNLIIIQRCDVCAKAQQVNERASE